MISILPNEEANFTEVFRTGRLWEVELKKQGVPFYQEEQKSGGLRIAKPVMPNMTPGIWWVVLVPEDIVQEAKTIISTLPIEVTKSPGVWHYNSGKPNRLFKWYDISILAMFLVGLLVYIFDLAGTLLNF